MKLWRITNELEKRRGRGGCPKDFLYPGKQKDGDWYATNALAGVKQEEGEP